jgi:hypothetical protein
MIAKVRRLATSLAKGDEDDSDSVVASMRVNSG